MIQLQQSHHFSALAMLLPFVFAPWPVLYFRRPEHMVPSSQREARSGHIHSCVVPVTRPSARVRILCTHIKYTEASTEDNTYTLVMPSLPPVCSPSIQCFFRRTCHFQPLYKCPPALDIINAMLGISVNRGWTMIAAARAKANAGSQTGAISIVSTYSGCNPPLAVP